MKNSKRKNFKRKIKKIKLKLFCFQNFFNLMSFSLTKIVRLKKNIFEFQVVNKKKLNRNYKNFYNFS